MHSATCEREAFPGNWMYPKKISKTPAIFPGYLGICGFRDWSKHTKYLSEFIEHWKLRRGKNLEKQNDFFKFSTNHLGKYMVRSVMSVI